MNRSFCPRISARRGCACALLMLIALCVPLLALAQQPGALAAPDLPLWTEGAVTVMAREADGSLLVGGRFLKVNGVPRVGLARILPNGSVDPAFNPGVTPQQAGVAAIHVLDDGSILVGGSFDSIGGLGRNRLAKLSATGVVDPNWNPGANSPVTGITAGSAGSVYVSGFFSSIGGQARSNIARLSTSGSGAADADWNPSPNGSINAVEYDAGSERLYVGGTFTNITGVTRGRLARITASGSASADAWTADADSDVQALRLDGDDLYVGGRFQFIAGSSRSGIVRLSTDTMNGDVDGSWAPSAPFGVSSMALDGDQLYIAGSFITVNGSPLTQLAALAVADGSLLPGFGPALRMSSATTLPGGRVYAFGDGAVHLVGNLAYVEDLRRLGYARFDANGVLQANLIDTLAPGNAEVLLPLADGGMLVGGNFQEAGISVRAHVLKLDASGALDAQWAPDPDGTVRALALSPDGNSVYLGGDFTADGALAADGLARVALAGSGQHDPSFAADADAPVLALAVAADGSVFAGGEFANIGGASRAHLARLSAADGSADSGFGAEAVNGPVSALAIDGALFAAGSFTTVGATARQGLARIDLLSGAADATWNANLSGGAVTDLLADAGQLYVTGNFTSIGGLSRTNLARIDATGSGAADATFDAAVAVQVDAVARIGDALYIGGSTLFVDNNLRRGLAKLALDDGALDLDWRPELYDGPLLDLAGAANGSLVIGGAFLNVYTSPRQGLAAIPATLAQLSISLGVVPQILYEDAPVLVQVTVGTTSGDPADLTLSATSSNTAVLDNASLAAGLGGNGANRTLLLDAVDDRNGPTTVTLTLGGGGASTQVSFDIEVQMVNDAPTLTIAGDRLHGAGSSGPQSVVGFASFDANDPVQSANYIVSWLRDANSVVTELQLLPNGTLEYTLSGASGGALFGVRVQDSGGTANGGIDSSATQVFRILVGDGANLSTSIERLPSIVRGKGVPTIEFVVRVSNNGPADVPAGITLNVSLPPSAFDMLWTCSPTTGVCTPAAGVNAVTTSFGLAVGEEARVDISLRSNTSFVDLAASAAPPQGVPAIDTGEARVTLSFPASGSALFKAGFE
jgi:hypothetical protein